MVPRELFETYPDREGRALMNGIVLDSFREVSAYRIGKSIYGAPLDALVVGKGRGRVAFFGTHHALETLTANILYAFVYSLADAGGRGARVAGIDARLLLDTYTFYVVPVVNPDGAELVRHGAASSPIGPRILKMCGGDLSAWQANGRGVDLNHNYSHGFLEYKRIEAERGIAPGAGLYSGEYPESEPESHAAAAFIRALAPSLVLSLHSQGEEVYSMPHTPYGERLGGRAASLCGYTLGIPSFTVEVGRGKNPLPTELSRSCFHRILPCLAGLPTIL